MFCDKTIKTCANGTKEYLGIIQTKQAEQKIIDVANTLMLTNVLVKIAGIDLIAKEAKFHHSCRAQLAIKSDRRKKSLSPIPEEPVNIALPLECVCDYVEREVIKSKRPEHLTSIYDRYNDICTELEIIPSITKVQYFGEVLKKRFPDRIILHSPACKMSGVIVHSSDIDYASIKVVYDFKSSPEGQVTQAALLLRQALRKVEKEPLTDPLTIDALEKGEGTPPGLVKTFFGVLLGGPDSRMHSESVKHRADSISHDALFIVKHGVLKPAKHILTAMSLKSLTGSKKIITMLNKFGSCLNYHAVEELETELAHAILERQLSFPDGATPEIPCGLAYDNYDVQTHTLSGAETLHDTMGIFHQACQAKVQSASTNPFQKQQDCLIPQLRRRGGHWMFQVQRLLHTGKNLAWAGFSTKT